MILCGEMLQFAHKVSTFSFQLCFWFDNFKAKILNNFKSRLLKYHYIYPWIVDLLSIYTILSRKCSILLEKNFKVLYLLTGMSCTSSCKWGVSNTWGADLSSVPQVLGILGHPQVPFLRPGTLGGLQWLGDQPLTCSWFAVLEILHWFPCIWVHIFTITATML